MLAEPQNRHLLIDVEAALKFGQPPTAFFGHTGHTEWEPWDYALARAYTILEKEKCSQCGNWVWVCHSSRSDVAFVTGKDICHATAAVQETEWRESHKPTDKLDKATKDGFGRRHYPKTKLLYDAEMPTREEYYEQ